MAEDDFFAELLVSGNCGDTKLATIKHKFIEHQVCSNTKILIIGTFNPDVNGNEAEFFYGRNRNYLWNLLPGVFNQKGLKNSALIEKKKFMESYKIDFADLIEEIKIDMGQENNYSDDYIDSKASKWNNIINILKSLRGIKEVYFTRSTFSGIPNIEIKIREIESYCTSNSIKFDYLLTPARFESENKIKRWKEVFNRNATIASTNRA